MERNTETLSTRDLASPNEPAGGVTASEGEVREAAAPEEQPGRYDQAAPAEEGHRSPRQGTQPPISGQRPTSRPAPRRRADSAPGRGSDGGLARDQAVEAGQPDPGLGKRAAPLARGRGQTDEINTGSFDAGSGQRGSTARRAGRTRPRTPEGRCFRPRWTPRSNNGGRRSRPGSSTSPEGRSRTPIAWSRTSCSNSQRASPRNGNGSKHSGAVGRTSPPRTCGSPCSAIGRSSSACCRPDNRSRIAPQGPADRRGASGRCDRADCGRPGVATSPDRRHRLPSHSGSGPSRPDARFHDGCSASRTPLRDAGCRQGGVPALVLSPRSERRPSTRTFLSSACSRDRVPASALTSPSARAGAGGCVLRRRQTGCLNRPDRKLEDPRVLAVRLETGRGGVGLARPEALPAWGEFGALAG